LILVYLPKAAAAVGFYGVAAGSQLLTALGTTGLMINLFNMVPIRSLDDC